MNNIISFNPDSWPEVIRNKYGINIDEHFWKNNQKNDPNTGEVTEWRVKPYNKVDEIAAYHDICYDMGRPKGDCDRDMVQSLDEIP